MKTTLFYTALIVCLGMHITSIAQKKTKKPDKTTARIWTHPKTQKSFKGKFLKQNNGIVYVVDTQGEVIVMQKRFLTKDNMKFVNNIGTSKQNNKIVVSKQRKYLKKVANG